MFVLYSISSIISFLIAHATVILQLLGLWFTFKKMGLPGWKGIIPYYGDYVLFDKLWDTKKFWRIVIYSAIAVVALILGYILMILGLVIDSSSAAAIIMVVLGVSFIIGALVMLILTLVIEYGLYRRLAAAFGLQNGWAWGLLFVPFIMFPIIGFHKRIQYYGPVNQV